MLYAGSLVFTQAWRARGSPRLHELVAVRARRRLASSVRPGQLARRPRASSGRARDVRRRRGVRAVGGQGAADRSRVGVRRARRARRRGVRVGRRVPAGRPRHGQHLAGRVPLAEPRDRWLRRHVAGRRVSAQRLRALRHDRQRLGVDDRLVSRRSTPATPTRPAAFRTIRSARRSRTATIPASPTSRFRARCSRAARISARRTTAGAIARPRVSRSRSTRRPATSASGASCACRAAHATGSRHGRAAVPRSRDHAALCIEAAAVVIVAAGAIEAFVGARSGWRSIGATHGARKAVWRRFGMWLLLGLEFELAADIIRSVISPTWQDIGELGGDCRRPHVPELLPREGPRGGERGTCRGHRVRGGCRA